MIEVEQITPRLYQTILEVKDYITQNSWGQHSNLQPGEYRSILNYELYEGFLKSRRGSKFLRADVDPERAGADFIKARINWDVGTEEHLLYYQDNKFYSQQLIPTVGNPILINDFSGGGFSVGTVSNDFTPDLVLEGGRLYIFHIEGNAVIEFDSGTFMGRVMGMIAPTINRLDTTPGGDIFGLYTYGVEKVYQKNDGDILASSPNRFKLDRTLAHTEVIEEDFPVSVQIEIDATELENDSLWTHVRLWRSKSQVTDNSDPLNPISPTGVDDQLFEVALITRAEIEGGSLSAIATSVDGRLPAGNINTLAGQPGGATSVFIISDNNTDDFLSFLVRLDGIELQPLLPSNLGVSHGNRIFEVTRAMRMVCSPAKFSPIISLIVACWATVTPDAPNVVAAMPPRKSAAIRARFMDPSFEKPSGGGTVSAPRHQE